MGCRSKKHCVSSLAYSDLLLVMTTHTHQWGYVTEGFYCSHGVS